MKGKNQLTTTRKQKNTPVTQIIDFFSRWADAKLVVEVAAKKMNNYNTENKERTKLMWLTKVMTQKVVMNFSLRFTTFQNYDYL